MFYHTALAIKKFHLRALLPPFFQTQYCIWGKGTGNGSPGNSEEELTLRIFCHHILHQKKTPLTKPWRKRLFSDRGHHIYSLCSNTFMTLICSIVFIYRNLKLTQELQKNFTSPRSKQQNVFPEAAKEQKISHQINMFAWEYLSKLKLQIIFMLLFKRFYSCLLMWFLWKGHNYYY